MGYNLINMNFLDLAKISERSQSDERLRRIREKLRTKRTFNRSSQSVSAFSSTDSVHNLAEARKIEFSFPLSVGNKSLKNLID